MCCLGAVWSCRTPKLVTVRDVRLGVANAVLVLAVILFVVVKAVFLDRG